MSRRNNLDREQLRRFGLYRLRLSRENIGRPVEQRLSTEQVRQKARDAVKMGRIGPSGERIQEWQEDTDPQASK